VRCNPEEETSMRFLRDASHLVRPAVVLLAGLGIFLVVRGAVIPKNFGEYGHYRPGALDEIRQHPLAFAGQAQCLECHDEGLKPVPRASTRMWLAKLATVLRRRMSPISRMSNRRCPMWRRFAPAATRKTRPSPPAFRK
jgi:hypothetical protein